MKIAIVDYSLGNTLSIVNALTSIGCSSKVTNSEKDLEIADGLVLSGVGNFGEGMQKLHDTGLFEILEKLVIRNSKPILGICLGLQLMTRGSEESKIPGFGWLPCKTQKISPSKSEKIPSIGWDVTEKNSIDKLTEGITPTSRFYFAHSYAIHDAPSEYVTLSSKRGKTFAAAMHKGNIYGVQFHPEKSYLGGERILRNFVELICTSD
jgi:glutamine amidotransferase